MVCCYIFIILHSSKFLNLFKNKAKKKKPLFYGPNRPLFSTFAESFFFYKKDYKISHIFEQKFFPKNCEWSEWKISGFTSAFWVSSLGKKKEKKNPDRLLFGICSPVEQVFFFLPGLRGFI